MQNLGLESFKISLSGLPADFAACLCGFQVYLFLPAHFTCIIYSMHRLLGCISCHFNCQCSFWLLLIETCCRTSSYSEYCLLPAACLSCICYTCYPHLVLSVQSVHAVCVACCLCCLAACAVLLPVCCLCPCLLPAGCMHFGCTIHV
jgi:hypothetical protein